MATRGGLESDSSGGIGRGPNNLPDVVGRFDRHCSFCGYLMVDAAFERPAICKQCYRVVPLHYAVFDRDPDGFTRCPCCYLIMPPGAMVCEVCGRRKQLQDSLPPREPSPLLAEEPPVQALEQAEAGNTG